MRARVRAHTVLSMNQCDVLMLNSIGPAFTPESVRAGGIGGSELEIVQIAEALTARGHRVVIANTTKEVLEQRGITVIPIALSSDWQTHALYVERMTVPPTTMRCRRGLVRATDVCCQPYDVHRPTLESGAAGLVGVSRWQVDGFTYARERHVVPPMLGETPAWGKKVPGRFVYASAPLKGLEATLAKWRSMKVRHGKVLRKARLVIVTPGHFDFYADRMPELTQADKAMGISYQGSPTVEEYRRLIASAEGLFYVNTMPETFCCAAAFAERSNTRTHILCKNGKGGIPEALVNPLLLTGDEAEFERMFLEAWQVAEDRGRFYATQVPDRRPEALAPMWEAMLQLQPGTPRVSSNAGAPAAGPTGPVGATSVEQRFQPEDLPHNRRPMPELLGGSRGFLALLRRELNVGGSEFGLGLSLFNLVAATRASTVVEIGRFKGFSTLALAAGLALVDEGWQEPRGAEQRPDVNYADLAAAKERRLVSIDPFPTAEAAALIKEAGLERFVQFVNEPSERAKPPERPIDVLFIDGMHTYEAVRRDYDRFAPHVRDGGYIVFHDMFGWYENGVNGSPIKRVVDEIQGDKMLVDTGYASLTVLRKTAAAILSDEKTPSVVPARADGQPTIGALIIARNENPILARAIASCRDIFDCITVVVDSLSTDGTRELAASMGAEVHVRNPPRPLGLASVRNDALRIAEQRTDYVCMLDADDEYAGSRPVDLVLDAYDVQIADGGVTYWRPQIVRSKKGFRYAGCDRECTWEVKHEYMVGIGTPGGRCAQLLYRRLGSSSERMRQKGVSGWQDQAGARDKYLAHARALHHHHLDHPECTRTLYYMGQSYQDAGDPMQAREWYRKRAAATNGNPEERYLAQFRVAEISNFLGEDPTSAYLSAYDIRPVRAEPLQRLSLWYRDDKRKQYELAYTFASRAAALPRPDQEQLFIETALYEWGLLEALGLAAHYTRRKDEAIACFERLVTLVPAHLRGWAQDTRAIVHRGL